MTKKKPTSNNSITSYTWLLLGIFIVVAAFSIKMILTYQQLTQAVEEKPDPVVIVVTPTKTPAKVPAKLK